MTVAPPGSAHGPAVWFDAELAPGIGFSNAPGSRRKLRSRVFFPLEQAVTVAPGDRVPSSFTSNLIDGSYIWGWNSRFHRAGGDEAGPSFRQSSFLAQVMSPQSLSLRSADFAPPARADHDVDRLCLSLIDGQRSHGAIAEELRSQFPDRFPSFAKAVDHVASLTARYR